MLHLRTRIIPAVVAPLLAASALVLSTPERAAAQVSVGFGVVIGRDQGRALPQYPRDGRYRPRNDAYFDFAYNTGYRDGYEKGLEDGRDRRVFDLMRHRRYRNADHNYNRRYGPRFEYERAYRDGFRVGYESAYWETSRFRGNPRGRDGWWRRY